MAPQLEENYAGKKRGDLAASIVQDSFPPFLMPSKSPKPFSAHKYANGQDYNL